MDGSSANGEIVEANLVILSPLAPQKKNTYLPYMSSPFLSAHWRRLLMLNYRVEPEILRPYLPAHTELDIWNNTCYVSLVGFMFLNTRIKSWRIPFHTNFEEINLRFYVRRRDPVLGWKRAVVFIREIVPHPATAWVANSVFREHYAVRRMRHRWHETETQLEVQYAWREPACPAIFRRSRWQSFGAQADPVPILLKPGSEAEFITEHYWGYSRRDERRTVEYQVEHPRWAVHPIRAWHCEVDFGAAYGPAFAALTGAEPASVFLAEGSDVAVGERKVIS